MLAANYRRIGEISVEKKFEAVSKLNSAKGNLEEHLIKHRLLAIGIGKENLVKFRIGGCEGEVGVQNFSINTLLLELKESVLELRTENFSIDYLLLELEKELGEASNWGLRRGSRCAEFQHKYPTVGAERKRVGAAN
uniref:Uncharacterized protein n=1 Tax=Ananas comosus var. bracteatus TaxID=296719 RepID=A0A6V7PGJ1_ANACO|nr:unnamed protein product [Ananas comosus var. bracteatus]